MSRIKHPYHSVYIDEVMDNLGNLFQYAKFGYGVDIRVFIEDFRKSKLAWGIEEGLPHYMVGMTGREMALFMYNNRKLKVEYVYPDIEFWIGWASAYLQWYTNLSFDRLYELVPADRLVWMYGPYHEMDISHLAEFAKTEILSHPNDIWVWKEDGFGEYRNREETLKNYNVKNGYLSRK